MSNKVNLFFSYFCKKNSYYLQAVYFKIKFVKIKLNLILGNFPYLNPINTKTKDDKRLRKLKKKILWEY